MTEIGRRLRELMRYGRHVGLANVIDYGIASAEGIVVGRVLGAISLGYFSIAKRLRLDAGTGAREHPRDAASSRPSRGSTTTSTGRGGSGSPTSSASHSSRCPPRSGLVVAAEPFVLACSGSVAARDRATPDPRAEQLREGVLGHRRRGLSGPAPSEVPRLREHGPSRAHRSRCSCFGRGGMGSTAPQRQSWASTRSSVSP